jgi:hypothetical protein
MASNENLSSEKDEFMMVLTAGCSLGSLALGATKQELRRSKKGGFGGTKCEVPLEFVALSTTKLEASLGIAIRNARSPKDAAL